MRMNPGTLRQLASKFLDMESSVHESGIKEGLTRSSIEKSYYYVFLVIRESLAEVGIEISKGSSAHSEITKHFSFFRNKREANSYERMMNSFRSLRNRATYELTPVITREEAMNLFEEINKFLESIEKLDRLGAKILNYTNL